MLNRKQIKIAIVLLAIFFLLQPILFPPSYLKEMPFTKTGMVFRPLLSNFLIIVLIWFNYNFLIEKYFFKKKFIVYFSVLFISMFGVIIVPNLFFGKPIKPPHFSEDVPQNMPELNHVHPHEHMKKNDKLFFVKEILGHHLFLLVALCCISIVIKIREQYEEESKQRKEAETALLNAQINPHFLFNALNSIYAVSIEEKANNTSNAILKLSDLLRYLDFKNPENFNLLQNEILFLKNYIDLQKMRLGDNVQLSVDIDDVNDAVKIGTLLFIPFIENAFKYGVNPSAKCDIDIKLKYKDKVVSMYCSNNKVVNKSNISSGIGIANTKKRLEILYPDCHTLAIENKENVYIVQLKINLK